MLTPRYELAVVAVNNILYAIGGTTSGATPIVEAYNPLTNTWSTKSPMSTARSLVRAAVLNGQIYIAGGIDVTGFEVSTAEVYNPLTDTWSTVPPMPTARYAFAAGAANGSFYVMGGHHNLNGDIDVATVEAFTPTPSPGVGPPTSKDQCKNGGWQTFNTPRRFKNQGDCVQFVNTGK